MSLGGLFLHIERGLLDIPTCYTAQHYSQREAVRRGATHQVLSGAAAAYDRVRQKPCGRSSGGRAMAHGLNHNVGIGHRTTLEIRYAVMALCLWVALHSHP